MPCKVTANPERLAEICRRWQVRELDLFGSALREDFRADSDVDLLVEFEPAARPSLFDLGRLEGELSELFGRQVDLATRRSIEASPNHIRRRSILGGAELFYRAA